MVLQITISIYNAYIYIWLMDCGKPIINPNRLRFINTGLVNMGMVYGLGRVGNCRVNFLLYQST